MHGKGHLDIYPLRVLYTLLTEQSVTHTAVKLGQSQPAISNTLKRLREITGDAILMHGKNGVAPTERGHDLLPLAQQSLEVMERIARPSQDFDPGNTMHTFHLGAPDYLDAFFLPNIAKRLRKQTPQAKLVMHPPSAGVGYLATLEQGGMDLVISNWLSPLKHLHTSPLFDNEAVCVLSAQHPLARKGIPLKHYVEMPHLAPVPYAMMQRSMIDQALAEQELRRQIQVSLPYFGLVPYVLVCTDLVFTTSCQFTAHCAQYLPIRILSTPMAFPKMRFYRLWHERNHAAPDVMWLHRMISGVAAELPQHLQLESAVA